MKISRLPFKDKQQHRGSGGGEFFGDDLRRAYETFTAFSTMPPGKRTIFSY